MTWVNAVQKQSTGTDDIIWSVKEILIHLTCGTTVRAGTMIMTGTPSGVGIFRKSSKHDDTVEAEIEDVAKLVDRVNFEKVDNS